MNVNDITEMDIVTNKTRHKNTTIVEVSFEKNGIVISASMQCQLGLDAENETQDKILKYLGFGDALILGLHYE